MTRFAISKKSFSFIDCEYFCKSNALSKLEAYHFLIIPKTSSFITLFKRQTKQEWIICISFPDRNILNKPITTSPGRVKPGFNSLTLRTIHIINKSIISQQSLDLFISPNSKNSLLIKNRGVSILCSSNKQVQYKQTCIC